MLKFQNISSGYGKKEILKNISFDIKKGSFTGIIGPNGSGKSTLLRTATKVITPQKGDIFIEDKPLRKISLEDLAKITSVVSQDTMFMFPFKVIDVVLMGRIPYINRLCTSSKKDLDIAHKALEDVDALDLKDRFIDEVSGGERQRIIVAKALAQEPKILFLDEPTTHLDITHEVEIFSLLKKLNKGKNLTVITVLHDLNLASEYSDELILLDKGKIKVKGAPEEVLDYKTIEEVYKTLVIVKKNPITARPHVFLVKK